MDNLIEKGEIDEKLNLQIFEYIKSDYFRKFILLYINKIRIRGKLKLKNPNSVKVLV